MERYQTETKTAVAAARDSYVWKVHRVQQAACVSWLVTGVTAVAMLGFLSEEHGGSVGRIWLNWLVGCLCGLAGHKVVKPLPGNERLLSGALGTLFLLIGMNGAATWKVRAAALMLGLSETLTLCSCRNHQLDEILRWYGVSTAEARHMQRHIPWMVSLAGLVLLMLCGGAVRRGRYDMGATLLALASALVVTLCAWNDPVDQRVLRKLERFRRFEEDPRGSKVLQEWLDRHLTEKSRRPWLVLFLIQFLRIFYHHRMVGLEKLREDDTNPVVYLANHGTIYGPVAARAFLPGWVRPWAISNIMTDLRETEEYLYKYTFSHVKFIPKRLRLPVTRVISRIAHWGMGALEAVPVYRDHLSQLMKTFRMTVDVLSGGDELLIFPENPNAAAQDHGYEQNGVGELFSGFTMLAPIYYKRTGKRCRFVPMYAHQASRTIAFGEEIMYDPERDDMEERERLVREISGSMNHMAEELEAAWKTKKQR